MKTTELHVRTGPDRSIVDLTDDCARFVAGEADGLLSVFVAHATAGLALIELGSGSEADLRSTPDRLLPRDDSHTPPHGPARERGTAGKIGQLNPLRRYGHPEEIAAAAVWLCSDESSFVTGAVLPVDGGVFAQ